MILIPCSGAFGGIVGRAVRAGRRLHGEVVTQHVLRVKVDDPDFVPDYVSAFLSSLPYGYPLLTAFRYGKDVPELEPNAIGETPIPLLPRPVQESVAKDISAATECLDKSNDIEDKAQGELLRSLKWTESTEEAHTLAREISASMRDAS